MSLDQNLFTLNVTARADDIDTLDLTDPNGVVHYTKRRVPGTEYTIEVSDPLSESVLATVTAPSATSKHKTLQLYNPDLIVELKYTGTIHFRWGFKWEEHEFEWRREECYILRKPDPAVLVAITKEPPGRLQTRSIQVLDYNLNRFDIDDRKGLEIVILTALLTFQDLNETYHVPRSNTSPSESTTTLAAVPTAGLANRLGLSRQPSQTLPTASPPAVPPRPEPRTGIERVAEMHAVRTAQGEGDANEIEVGEECVVDDYAQYAERLLNDEAMLFVTVRSATAAQVPKVLRVVEETKRLRHKSGVADDEELYQYVIYDTLNDSSKRKGPKRINLDDPNSKTKGKELTKYAPPTSLTVHLSKIDMPELQPRLNPGTIHRPSGSGRAPAVVPEASGKERKKAEKERKSPSKEGKKYGKHKNPAPVVVQQPANTNKLTKPSASSPRAPAIPERLNHTTSFFGRHVPSHQTHPYQPSPSPSQLNNPTIYTSPHLPAPNISSSRYNPTPSPPSMSFPSPDIGVGQLFYGSAVGTGYGAMPAPSGPGYRPRDTGPVRPVSYHAPPSTSGGKGPVTSLLEMWSKH
ncbi:hypothetical protein BC628DRAFT_1401730 [Trametes gibbosa]|nr:hypothetical protein BC628DRAFT_1401730 [Trametes gibbosa]